MNIFSSIQEEEHTVDGLFGVTEFNLVALIGAAAVVVVVVDDVDVRCLVWEINR